jgi:RimJ/RimL family protein N-acetyltransferase
MVALPSAAPVTFRRLAADDLPALFLWLAKPHVAKWYAPAPSSYAEVVARYGPRVGDGNAVRAHIVMTDGVPVGYAQHYAVRDFPDYARAVDGGEGMAAMDLFIGEEAHVGKGLGPRVIRRYVEDIVFADASIVACVADPAEGNAASIRAFEKAGFRRWRTVHFDGASISWILCLDRRSHRGTIAIPEHPIDPTT